MIVATILSGGVSSRMGYPKALLHYRGRTFLQNILDVTAAAGIVRRLVVVGPEPGRILSQHELRGVTVVTNPVPESGPIGSIRASIEALRVHPVTGLLVWPVDLPHVALKTVERIIDTAREHPDSIVLPTVGGRRGHPVLFPRAVFAELEAAADVDGESARSVVRSDPDRVVAISVDDPAVVDTVNTPKSYERLLRMEDRIRE